MIKPFLSFLLLLASLSQATTQTPVIPTPDEFLGYPLGSRFTPHSQVVEYFKKVDQASEQVKLETYGETYEGRPLIAAIVSSAANMKRLEEIRLNNLRRSGFWDGTPVQEDIAIVYLSYSVHGNEAAGSESSMAVLYDLVSGNPTIKGWLDHAVVILDPSLNPDGYSRYTQWSNSVSSTPFNPNPDAREHHEPWPGGRFNHYYFDLNRDWAWQTQQETQERITFYQEWMPHVHADLHEMGSESPYYFAPAAKPYHPDVTEWQVAFQTEIGKNHAAHFDKKGWRYYTRERFDLFYPGFGDTYPTFSGAIGMTYEQGGGGYANRGVLLENGDTLTLFDRIAHHREASLSTIEVSSVNAARLIKEYTAYFEKANSNPPGNYETYIIRASAYPSRVDDLMQLLNAHTIIFGMITEERKELKGFSYQTGQDAVFTAKPGDIMIPAAQSQAVLLHVLFEPESFLSDSLSYDITAWSLPMAFGVEAYATTTAIDFQFMMPGDRSVPLPTSKPFGYALEWGSVQSAEILTKMLQMGFNVRVAPSPFRVGDISYESGTILLLRADNRKDPEFDSKAMGLYADVRKHYGKILGTTIRMIETGFADEGKDLGSDEYHLVRRPEVLAFAGDGISPSGLGEAWHFFEQELHQTLSIADLKDLQNINLDLYNVILLTDGYYTIDDTMLDKISTWVGNGGRLIAIGSGINKLAGRKNFGIQIKSGDVTDINVETDSTVPEAYAGGDRKSLSHDIPGTVFQTVMDHTNPLTFGLGQAYWTLRTSSNPLAWLPDNGNAIYLDDTPRYFGFAGYKALNNTKNTLVAGLEYQGAGSVVYLADNPLFRSFWNSGKVLFANALFF